MTRYWRPYRPGLSRDEKFWLVALIVFIVALAVLSVLIK